MKFKKLDEPVFTDDPYYDLTDGGYINPEELLENKEDADKVNEAIRLVEQFLQEAQDQGALEMC